MKFVVKLGGSALEDQALLHGCARAIAMLAQDGNQVAVVHGGGVALTRTLKQMGKQSEFIAGLRITDAETRDAALMVLGGRVNKELVAALGGHGQTGVGLSGGDGLIFRARKKRTTPDLGFVGEIVASDTRWLDAIWKMGAVPVISSLALGLRRRVLQHQRRRNGVCLRGRLQGRCPGLSYRRARRARIQRRGDALVERGSDSRPDAGRSNQRRYVAQAERLPRGVVGGGEESAHLARGCGISIT